MVASRRGELEIFFRVMGGYEKDFNLGGWVEKIF
jgi:hypothetical protein